MRKALGRGLVTGTGWPAWPGHLSEVNGLTGQWQRPVMMGTWAQPRSACLLPVQGWQAQAGRWTGTVTPLKEAGRSGPGC